MIRTALVFSTSQIDLVQIDPDTKNLVTAFSQALAPQTIVRGQIYNKETFKQALLQIQAKLKQTCKHVVLIVPEDAVISKTIDLPKLKKNEIDEAVRFAAEEYLPYSLDKAVLDWKMLPEKDNLHVLFQAIESTIVNDYVQILADLHITVDVIETPAMAMIQISNYQPEAGILIHVGTTEAVLTLVKEYEIIATSMVSASPKFAACLQRTIIHMTTYYHDFPVKWIQVGGLGVTSEIVKTLSTLQISVQGFVLPVTVQPAVANTYLLGLSAAVRDITPPSDQDTINLLPPNWVSSQNKQKSLAFFTTFFTIVAIGFLFTCLGLTGVYLWLEKQQTQLKAAQASPSNPNAKAMSVAGMTNSLSSLALKLASDDQFPTDFADSIIALQKDDVKLAQVNLNLLNKKGEIVGIANNRTALLNFKQSLEKLPQIQEIVLPASSFVEDKNIPFQINFTIKTEDKKT